LGDGRLEWTGPASWRGIFLVSWLGEHHAFRLAEATRVWSSHTLMACVFILGIWLVEKFTYLLWGRELPLLFGGSRYSIFFTQPTLAMRAYMGEGR
jgi:hypothetical protein